MKVLEIEAKNAVDAHEQNMAYLASDDTSERWFGRLNQVLINILDEWDQVDDKDKKIAVGKVNPNERERFFKICSQQMSEGFERVVKLNSSDS
jgi:hypothetical protein